jgi:hypothetical protein
MELTKEQRKFYEETREMARKEIEDIERKIEEELARVKQRLIDLQNAKKASRQIYDGACSPSLTWTSPRRCRPRHWWIDRFRLSFRWTVPPEDPHQNSPGCTRGQRLHPVFIWGPGPGGAGQ